VLPRIGRVKLHENGARLADLVAAEAARVLGVSVRFERGRWFAAFTAEQDMSRPSPADPGAVVGIDLGIKTLAVLSTGEEIPNPRHLGRSLRKVRGPGSSRRTGGAAHHRRWGRLRAGSLTSAGMRCIRPLPT
jgi:putative transposase